MPNFDMTKNTWTQQANQQAYEQFTEAKLNVSELPVSFDPIYGELVEQISKTMYHELAVTQQWRNIGITNPSNDYPGIIREIAMKKRKGQNFAMDAGVRPTTLNNYEIYNDDIIVRYHSAQFRWMYPYTIFDEELRRFSGNAPSTISQLTELKQINAISSRNMFMDTLRKKTLSVLSEQIAKPFKTEIDITDFKTLTKEDAQTWLVMMDNLLHELKVGTAKYNGIAEFIQCPKANLQMIMPYEWYMNVIRRAFPDTYNTESFKNILPENLILVDSMGDEKLLDEEGIELQPTFDSKGMNTLNWNSTRKTAPRNADLQAVIMDKRAMGIEDNLNIVMVGTKDIEKLATPVRNHYWTKVWMNDILPVVKVVK